MSKATILQRLNTYSAPESTAPSSDPTTGAKSANGVDRFIAQLEAVKGQVVRCQADTLVATLIKLLDEKQVKRLCAGRCSEVVALLQHLPTSIRPICDDLAIENFKHTLFHDVDAGLTCCHAALAETGSLVLIPTPEEPRLLSLVPPIHIVVLHAQQLYDNLASWIEQQAPQPMPTNLLLITGPSKSADIEQVLAYGVHGPRQLVVLLVE